MNENYPAITVSIPVRNRAWILPHVLESLEEQIYLLDNLAFRFISHNSRDGTTEMLRQWAMEQERYYRFIEVIEFEDDTPEDGRTSKERNRKADDPRHTQAFLKNWLMDLLVKEDITGKKYVDEYFFFCDSDILLHPLAIKRLVEAKKDIVGGLTNVVPRGGHPLLCNYFPLPKKKGGKFKRNHGEDPPTELTEVGLVAGILLYSPKAVQACRFSFDAKNKSVGEDEGAIRMAEAAGISVWLEPGAMGLHVMNEQDMEPMVKEWQQWQKE